MNLVMDWVCFGVTNWTGHFLSDYLGVSLIIGGGLRYMEGYMEGYMKGVIEGDMKVFFGGVGWGWVGWVVGWPIRLG